MKEKSKSKSGVEVEGRKAKPKRLPIWKTAKHGTVVESKITLPHAEDVFTAQRMMADALPACCGIVSLEVKYVLYHDWRDSRELANQCWDEYMEATRVNPIIKKEGGAK